LTRAKLAAAGDVEDPGLESEVLIRHMLNLTRAQLFTDLSVELSPGQQAAIDLRAERRLDGEPLAYIINSREFYGLDFFVDSRVLIPRPETELLVEETIRLFKDRTEAVLADIGTGSGAIAVSVAVNLAAAKILATDVSPQALEAAGANARRHRVEERIDFLQGDLLEPLKSPADAIIANLPYVRTSDWQAMPSAAFEPRIALDGGQDGLDYIKRLIDHLPGKVKQGGYVLLEIGLGQAEAVILYVKKAFPETRIEVLKDLAGIDRVVEIKFRLF
jgi:release factor glutamine methyltransferase